MVLALNCCGIIFIICIMRGFSIIFNKRNLNLIQWIWKFLKDYGMCTVYLLDKANVIVDNIG